MNANKIMNNWRNGNRKDAVAQFAGAPRAVQEAFCDRFLGHLVAAANAGQPASSSLMAFGVLLHLQGMHDGSESR